MFIYKKLEQIQQVVTQKVHAKILHYKTEKSQEIKNLQYKGKMCQVSSLNLDLVTKMH